MATQYDFLAIGDTVTDAFIRLKEASVHCTIDNEKCEICMRFADKIPYEEVYVIPAVGNSANAAVSASRLGLKSALVAHIGDDYFGKECIDALSKEKVGTEFVITNNGMKTNYHYVLWYEDDRTILIKHEAYKYFLPDIGEPKWIYLSSAGERAFDFHIELEKYLEVHPSVSLAFQPGTYQMRWGTEKLAGVYKKTKVFICNKEEYQRVLKTEEEDVKKLLLMLHELGPEIAVLTDGPKGAYASDGKDTWFMPAFPDPKPPFERTGAGDAFSSTFVVSLAQGKSIPEALVWAPVNSMSVVQQVGARAGLLSSEQIQEHLKTAPANYRPTFL